MTEIAVRDEGTLQERLAYAETLADADLLPRQYRQKPANVLYAVDYGRSLGLDAVQAMNSVHVIEGRPAPSSGLIGAMARKAGHRLRVRVEYDQQGSPVAIAQIIRSDDPEWTFECRWTMKRAQQAGVTGKQVWRAYPEAMLKARAITEVAREACEEALLGFSHSAEELGAEVDADGNVVEAKPAQGRPGATVAEAVAEAAQEEAEEPAVPRERMNRMGRLMREAGITTAEQALSHVADVIGREIASRGEMTAEEVEEVIDDLEPAEAAPAAEGPVDAEIVEEPPDGQ